MKKCAYCSEIKSALTREHVFPNALDKEFRKDGSSMREPYWIDRLDEKMVGGEPTVKDVCQEFAIQNPDWSALISRTVIFQSFFFSIFSVNEKAPAVALAQLKKLFQKYQKNAVPLIVERNCVSVSAGMSSEEAINTHILLNTPYYAKKFPNIFDGKMN